MPAGPGRRQGWEMACEWQQDGTWQAARLGRKGKAWPFALGSVKIVGMGRWAGPVTFGSPTSLLGGTPRWEVRPQGPFMLPFSRASWRRSGPGNSPPCPHHVLDRWGLGLPPPQVRTPVYSSRAHLPLRALASGSDPGWKGWQWGRPWVAGGIRLAAALSVP